MLEQLLSLDFVQKAIATITPLLDSLTIYISGLSKVKLIALGLIVSALTIFIILIIVVIFHNIIILFKRDVSTSKIISQTDQTASPFSEDEQQELELELQKELDLALAQRAELEQKKEREQQEKIKQQEEEKRIKRKKKEEEKEEHIKETEASLKNTKDLSIDFDWQKQKQPISIADFNFPDNPIDTSMLSYQQKSVELNQLIGLLVDMISRDVDELKIAQTLSYKTQNAANENDILKLIDAVNYFISLCQSDKFTKLSNYSELPEVGLALYHLANNDVSLSLVLLEHLMDQTIDKANGISENKKQQLFAEISNYACCLGALAETNDVMLATSVYEMAIELNSSNATAWSRLGDVYRLTNSESRAIWAYQNAYSFADSEINATELANAGQHLSDYLYAQGNTLQAAKMHNVAKQYYDSLGITEHFSQDEIEALSIIESNHQKNLPEIITKLLQNSKE